ncbi:hypothetical protein MNBD_GAMMA21-1539 [hydrothermal vent metagenome]|uniref:Uncharacterized protein n=1 Tax=hydrothermal vent metagenome TaxID=652676 RepID=A0A3B1ASR9_9ZZZZ
MNCGFVRLEQRLRNNRIYFHRPGFSIVHGLVQLVTEWDLTCRWAKNALPGFRLQTGLSIDGRVTNIQLTILENVS